MQNILFLPSPVLILLTQGGMARLSWPGWLGQIQGLDICRWPHLSQY